MFCDKDPEHFWEIMEGLFDALSVDHVKVKFINYISRVEEFLHSGCAPVLIDDRVEGASDSSTSSHDSHLLERKVIIDELSFYNAS